MTDVEELAMEMQRRYGYGKSWAGLSQGTRAKWRRRASRTLNERDKR